MTTALYIRKLTEQILSSVHSARKTGIHLQIVGLRRIKATISNNQSIVHIAKEKVTIFKNAETKTETITANLANIAKGKDTMKKLVGLRTEEVKLKLNKVTIKLFVTNATNLVISAEIADRKTMQTKLMQKKKKSDNYTFGMEQT